jgi:hypothetical protein
MTIVNKNGGIDSGLLGLHPFGATLCVVQNYILVV